MITVKKFIFNAFQVNSYLLFDETRDCILIDPAVSSERELTQIKTFIEENQLHPVLLVNTHSHIDHLLGNQTIAQCYKLKLAAHQAGSIFIDKAVDSAKRFGLPLESAKNIDVFLKDQQDLSFGNSHLKVLYTPGHADGSISLYAQEARFVISGDVLFYQSIGRTDLPTGDYDLLQKSIWEQLFTLPDETIVLPGHGSETTIGSEKVNNPFVAIGM